MLVGDTTLQARGIGLLQDKNKNFYALYFAVFLTFGVFFPYSNLYFKRLGLSGTEIGIIGSISPFVVLFAQPMWGMLTDWWGGGKRIMILNMLICSAMMFIISFLTGFYSIVLAMAVLSIFQCALAPLLDSSLLHYLGGRDKEYGTFRLWGSVGYAVANLMAGQIIRYTSIKSIFYMYSILMLATLLISRGLPEGENSISKQILSDMKGLLKNYNFIIFLIVAFLTNTGSITAESYFGIYMDQIHGSEALIGLAWFIAAMSEIPIFFFSARIIKRWGNKRVMCAALLIFAIRVGGYSVIKNPYGALVIQVLNGMDFAPFYAAAVTFVNAEVPGSLRATGQALFAMVGNSMAGIVGNFIGGYLLDQVGVITLFRIFAICILLAFALAAVALRDHRFAKAYA